MNYTVLCVYMDGWMGGWLGGWIDRQTDRQMDGADMCTTASSDAEPGLCVVNIKCCDQS